MSEKILENRCQDVMDERADHTFIGKAYNRLIIRTSKSNSPMGTNGASLAFRISLDP